MRHFCLTAEKGKGIYKMSNSSRIAFRLISGAVVFGLTSVLGKLVIPLIFLGVLMLTDYATGLSSAWMRGELSSKISIIGIIKKVSYLAVIAVGVGCDYVIRAGMSAIGYDFSFAGAISVIIVIWLIVNEMISVLENLSEMGIPIPAFLLSFVKRLKITTEKAGNKTANGENTEESEKNKDGENNDESK